jgi:hypothetical protein
VLLVLQELLERGARHAKRAAVVVVGHLVREPKGLRPRDAELVGDVLGGEVAPGVAPLRSRRWQSAGAWRLLVGLDSSNAAADEVTDVGPPVGEHEAVDVGHPGEDVGRDDARDLGEESGRGHEAPPFDAGPRTRSTSLEATSHLLPTFVARSFPSATQPSRVFGARRSRAPTSGRVRSWS